MWEARVDGRTLHFHLAAINNQNFIMSDEETGTWWQQVSGEAILGPLRGRRLRAVSSEIDPFATFRAEHSSGRVLRPDPHASAHYEPVGFESSILRLPTVTRLPASDRLAPRALVAGVTAGTHAVAYPLDVLRAQTPIVDDVGDVPVVVVLAPDGTTVRAFDRTVDGQPVEFLARAEDRGRLVDARSGSEWDLTGLATSGPLAGRQLRRIDVLVEYWFDWRTYHPDTRVYAAGR